MPTPTKAKAKSISMPAAPAHLLSWQELIAFLEASHIVSNERGSTLLALSGSEPDAAQTLLARSTDLRDSLRKIFGAMVRKEGIAPDWTEPINRILRITERHDELGSADSGWKFE